MKRLGIMLGKKRRGDQRFLGRNLLILIEPSFRFSSRLVFLDPESQLPVTEYDTSDMDLYEHEYSVTGIVHGSSGWSMDSLTSKPSEGRGARIAASAMVNFKGGGSWWYPHLLHPLTGWAIGDQYEKDGWRSCHWSMRVGSIEA